jgi:UDP-N-acetylglucosamine diphosphorylase/glucosamine-1-phosphate N-acetyltransferase
VRNGLQAVILAGGTGKRVFPLAVHKPKPMFKVLGKPLVQYTVEALKEAGLKDFIIVIGHKGAQIRDHLGDGTAFGVHIEYTVQREALGMADALKTAQDLVEDQFFVVNADDVFESSLITQMLARQRESGAGFVLSCKHVEETWKFGIIAIEGERVTRFVEKPPKGKEPSNLAVVGAYVVPKEIFDYYEKTSVSDHQYEDAVQLFIEDGNLVSAVVYDGLFAGYKFPWDLFTINEYLMSHHLREQRIEEGVEVSERAVVEGMVCIRSGTKVLAGACVSGPCYIGANSLVGNNTLIRDYSSLGDNCVVGFSTEIKHSLIGDDCWFHMNYVGDSLIGDGCSFGAGTVTANYRFDEKPVRVSIRGRRVDSGLDKLGAIIGDGCKTGITASLAPGVKIGPHSIIGPNVNLQKDLEPGMLILAGEEGYVMKENTLTISPKKRQELTEELMKY